MGPSSSSAQLSSEASLTGRGAASLWAIALGSLVQQLCPQLQGDSEANELSAPISL